LAVFAFYLAPVLDLHRQGLSVSSFPARTSAGYLISLAKDFSAFILLTGGIVSVTLPSIAGSQRVAFTWWADFPDALRLAKYPPNI